ncbi:MAG: hypothetical protein ABIP20_16755 [Chthoniobacteraceae bacterium]
MSSKSRIELYKEAMAIEHERAALQAKLDQLHTRIEHISAALFSASAAAPATATVKSKGGASSGRPVSSGKKPRAARGELKQRILEALAAAGNAGVRVRDLAVSIGSKPAALHSWFQFARKSIKAVRKAGTGRYRLVGALPDAAPAPAAKLRPAKAGTKTSGKQRGHLSESVHAALKSAGKDGIRVGDLAKSLGINPRNLFVWFATTGKKFKAIKKASPGHYRLQG